MKFMAFTCLLLFNLPGSALPEEDFLITVKTDADNTSDHELFVIPTLGSGYDYNVDCNNDGMDEATGVSGDYICDYSALGGPGSHTIRIKDNTGAGTGFPRFFASKMERNGLKIMSIDQWGTGQWVSMKEAFYKAWNLQVVATDAPNLSIVTDMSYMFSATALTDPDFSLWDVSNVDNMSHLFASARFANPDVSGWNVSSVTDMSHMFWDARSANPNVSDWDVSAVTTMRLMFHWATQANPDVSRWDVSSVTDLSGMFWFAEAANPDMSQWDVSKVTSMGRLFEDAPLANPNVRHWDVSSVVDMTAIFSGASAANPDVSQWDVSSVKYMGYMFREAVAANPDVSAWDVSAAINMEAMFSRATAAYPDVSRWDVSSVTNMSGMFFRSRANPDVSEWDVSEVTNMNSLFASAHFANPDVSQWDVASVIHMSGLFSHAIHANPDVRDWNVSSVTNMDRMFQGANSASPDLSQWNVTSVLSMQDMFHNVNLPPRMYDATLRNFSEQELQTAVNFSAGSSNYCEAETQRNALIFDYGWVIEDQGKQCGQEVAVSFNPLDEAVTLGESMQLTLTVSNAGFEDAFGATVTTFFSPSHNNLSWTCQAVSESAVCPNDQGLGNLSELVDLRVGEELVYVFSFDLVLSVWGGFESSAIIQLGQAAEDIYPANNFDLIFYDLNPLSKYTSGAWYDSDHSGHGLFLEVLPGSGNQAERINLFWFTHHDAESIWLGGVGEIIDDKQVDIQLNITQGADFPPNFDAADVVSESWGSVRLEFESPRELKLSWDADQFPAIYGMGEIVLNQLSTITDSAKGCLSGSFFDPNQSGHGLFIHVTENPPFTDQLNVSWFVYDQGELLWLIGSAILNENNVAEMTLMKFSGASFFMPGAPNGWSYQVTDLIEQEWGSLVVTYLDANNLHASFQPNDTSQYESGSLSLTRLTRIYGHGCSE